MMRTRGLGLAIGYQLSKSQCNSLAEWNGSIVQRSLFTACRLPPNPSRNFRRSTRSGKILARTNHGCTCWAGRGAAEVEGPGAVGEAVRARVIAGEDVRAGGN